MKQLGKPMDEWSDSDWRAVYTLTALRLLEAEESRPPEPDEETLCALLTSS